MSIEFVWLLCFVFETVSIVIVDFGVLFLKLFKFRSITEKLRNTENICARFYAVHIA